ncbi:hypothetical protein ACFQS1_02005 [Paractinoplanes rhizophilus]|uniref:Serine/threonine protein kinase n=1 Tax=Paractinoplanes rhizophilus TaxID=1416877 RepID=A0ABW2HM29_9ACTN
MVAVIALVFGLSGAALAALALGRSDQAVTLAASAGGAPAPAAMNSVATPTPDDPAGTPAGDPSAAETTDPAADPATGQAADPATSASPGDISPTAKFEVAYEGEKLKIRSEGCRWPDNYALVDLDEPRVGAVAETGEFGYAGCDPGKIDTKLPFAVVPGASATPADCLETIRTDPGRSPIAPTRGMTLCFLTSQDAAATQGISQKLAFVTIDAITVDNNTGVLNVSAKAWNVPQ